MSSEPAYSAAPLIRGMEISSRAGDGPLTPAAPLPAGEGVGAGSDGVSSQGGGAAPSSSSAASSERMILRITKGAQWTFQVLFATCLIVFLVKAPPWEPIACEMTVDGPAQPNYLQQWWPFVWLVNLNLTVALLLAKTYLEAHRSTLARTPRNIALWLESIRQVHKGTKICALVLFFVGVKPLFWDAPCASFAVTMGRVLWWFHASFTLIPLAITLTLCLCLPCIVIGLRRVGPVSANEQPTPAALVSKLECRSYGDLKNHLSAGGAGGSNALSIIAAAATGNSAAVASPLEKACPICMVEFEDDNKLLVMPCDQRHFFHDDCVRQWLEHSQLCPICRANIVTTLETRSSSPDDQV